MPRKVEPSARHLRAAFHVDRAEDLTELEVITGFEVECGHLTDSAQLDEIGLAPGGDAVDDDVLDACESSSQGLGSLVRRLLRLLDALGEILGLRHERRLLVFRRLRDLLAERVLLGPQLLERGERRAARSVGLERDVDGALVVATGGLRTADDLRIFAEECEVDHPPSLWCGPGASAATGWVDARVRVAP